MFRPIYIAIFELKRYLTNKGELAFSIALPIALFALMYGAFGGGTNFNATVDIVDLDGGVHARELISRLDALDELSVRERDLQNAESALERSVVLFVVVIPDGFTSWLESGESPRLTYKQRGNGGETGQIVAAIVGSTASELGSGFRVSQSVSEALDSANIESERLDRAVQITMSNAQANPPVGVTVTGTKSDEGDVLDRLMPGILVMFLMFAVTLGSQSLVDERRGGTLERLMTTRLGTNQLFIGKYLAGVFRASCQATVLLTLAFAVLRFGGLSEILQLAAFSVLIASAVTAVGLVIGSAARTRDQAIWAAVFFTMFMTVFGGTFFDVGSDGPLFLLSKVTINHYGINAMSQMLADGSQLTEQLVGVGIMLGVTVIGLVIARIIFRVS